MPACERHIPLATSFQPPSEPDASSSGDRVALVAAGDSADGAAADSGGAATSTSSPGAGSSAGAASVSRSSPKAVPFASRVASVSAALSPVDSSLSERAASSFWPTSFNEGRDLSRTFNAFARGSAYHERTLITCPAAVHLHSRSARQSLRSHSCFSSMVAAVTTTRFSPFTSYRNDAARTAGSDISGASLKLAWPVAETATCPFALSLAFVEPLPCGAEADAFASSSLS